MWSEQSAGIWFDENRENIYLVIMSIHRPYRIVIKDNPKEFLREIAEQAMKEEIRDLFTEQDWDIHRLSCHRVVKKKQEEISNLSTGDAVKRVRGQTGEDVFYLLVRSLLHENGSRFQIIQRKDCATEIIPFAATACSLEFRCDESPYNYHVRVPHLRNGSRFQSQECDLLAASDRHLLLFDVTTSMNKLDLKVDRDNDPASISKRFSNELERVFDLSEGKHGYESVSKVNVLLANSRRSSLVSAGIVGKGTYVLRLPLWEDTSQIAVETARKIGL